MKSGILREEGAALRDTPWGPVALDFGDWEAEYRAFRQRAGLFRPPAVTQVEITGSQRAEFLNRLCTNKLDQIRPGEGWKHSWPMPTAGFCTMYSFTPGRNRWSCTPRPGWDQASVRTWTIT